MIPTKEELKSFTGAHCTHKWKYTKDDWKCPGCSRTKYQIVRKIPDEKQFAPGNAQQFKLTWAKCLHHDHGTDHPYHLTKRFHKTNLCELCNTADGAVKRQLNLPEFFSFAPWEIAKFIKAKPHLKHEIDYEAAKKVFRNLYTSGKLEFKYRKKAPHWVIEKFKRS